MSVQFVLFAYKFSILLNFLLKGSDFLIDGTGNHVNCFLRNSDVKLTKFQVVFLLH